MSKLYTLSFATILFSWILFPGNHLQAQTCVIVGTVDASSDPFGSCPGTPTQIKITGTLNINVSYNVISMGNLLITVDGGTIAWTSKADFRLAAGSKIELINGGKLSNAEPCGANKTLSFGASKIASCNGGGPDVFISFAQINAAGGIDGNGLLPVELSGFAAKAEPNRVRLTWTTVSEIDNDYFEVLRSSDGRNFTAIGKLDGAGTTYERRQYLFYDEQPLTGTSYYRLRQVDFDGKFSFSNVLTMQWKATRQHELTVVPNPVTTREPFRVGLSIDGEQPRILLTNLLGQKIPLTFTADEAGFSASLPAGLAPGHYILQVYLKGKVYSESVVVR